MLAEVGCIIVGIPLGFALRTIAPIVRIANGMASGIIYALLFLLGVSLGSNEQLFARLGELGVQGFSIGLACALGSVAVTACIANKFFQLSTMQNTAPSKAPAGNKETPHAGTQASPHTGAQPTAPLEGRPEAHS